MYIMRVSFYPESLGQDFSFFFLFRRARSVLLNIFSKWKYSETETNFVHMQRPTVK